MIAASPEVAAERAIPVWVQRTIACAVCLAVVGGLAATVWSQRVTAPVNGQSLNLVQGVAAAIDLPKGWGAVKSGPLSYVAVEKGEPMVPHAAAAAAAPFRKAAAAAVRAGQQYVPSKEVNAIEKALGSSKVAVLYYAAGELTTPDWNVYYNDGTVTDHDDQYDTRAQALAAAEALRTKDYTVIDAG